MSLEALSMAVEVFQQHSDMGNIHLVSGRGSTLDPWEVFGQEGSLEKWQRRLISARWMQEFPFESILRTAPAHRVFRRTFLPKDSFMIYCP